MKNRWLIAACAVGIHISIGSVYAWSVASKPIVQAYGWDLKQVSLTFSIAIFFLGLSAAFLGRFIEKKGPRFSGALAAVLFGLGVVGAGLACRLQSLPLLYLTYGVMGGIGLGIGYLAPVSTLIRWFPDRRGLATGMAIMGFGFAALVSGPIMQRLIGTLGIPQMFYILGGAYFLLMFLSSQYLAPPPDGWRPPSVEGKDCAGRCLQSDLAQMTASEAMRTPRFYYLWAMLFLNVTCGIAVISVASPMAQEAANLTPRAAALMVGLMGLFNGLGRIGWSAVSDHLGRSAVWIAFFLIQILAFFTLPSVRNPLLFQAVIFLIISCYGGGFASMPAYVSDLFGTRQVSAIYGGILTAWSAAGVVGPLLVAWVRETTGAYSRTLYLFGGVFVAALAVSLLLVLDIRKLKKETQQPAEARIMETAARE